MTPTPEVIKALSGLDGNREFQIFLAWIEQGYQVEVAKLLDLTDQVLVHQSQGYARCLADVLGSVKTNHTALDRLVQGGRMNT